MVKIDRSYPAPASLAEEAKKVSGSYNKPDVVRRLCEDFHNKCYICEAEGLRDPQVEHLLPHMNDRYPERKFDWDNLFLVCAHCNNIKNKGTYDSGILDCCKVDPEEYMLFRLVAGEAEILVKKTEDAKANLTAELVNEVFNLKNTGIREAACAQRIKELRKEMIKLWDSLNDYKNNRTVTNRRKIRVLLKRESAYAAFKRCYVREQLSVDPEYSEFLEDVK